jgi:hypothetical protein
MAKLCNFEFLKEHDPVFFQLAFAAEQSFSADPNTTLIKLRQLGEAFAQDMAVRCGIEFDEKTSQADLLFKLNREIRIDPTSVTYSIRCALKAIEQHINSELNTKRRWMACDWQGHWRFGFIKRSVNRVLHLNPDLL